jgi:hypothetical protein
VPSFRVTEPQISLKEFDVVGRDGDEPGFVAHTGLAESAGLHGCEKVPVIDMAPPLHGNGAANQVTAHVVGTADLTHDELQKIRTFVDRHANEHLAFQQFRGRRLLNAVPQMYCILPHSRPYNEADGRYCRTLFSCAGFVLEAYRFARIALLLAAPIPSVDLAILRLAYPVQFRLIDRGPLRLEDLGLEGPGPWPVLLCGYLFHGLNRDADSIRRQPYQPGPDDWYFR